MSEQLGGGTPGGSVGTSPLPASAVGGAIADSPPSVRSVVALVLAVLSWVLCMGLLSLPAFLLARSEIDAIERRTSPLRGLRYAKPAYWIAVANLVVVVPMMIALAIWQFLAP